MIEIQGRHINTHVRRDGGPKLADFKVKKSFVDGKLVLSIYDEQNVEFWIVVKLTKEELKDL